MSITNHRKRRISASTLYRKKGSGPHTVAVRLPSFR